MVKHHYLPRFDSSCSLQIMKYSWIKVKQHKFDPNKSWEENYKLLEEHHRQETEFLISLVPENIKQSSSVVNQADQSTTSTVVTHD